MSEAMEVLLQICPESPYYLEGLELGKRLFASISLVVYCICFTWVFTSLFLVFHWLSAF